MDFNDFWEQSKRWVLGVVAGLLLFWIGTAIVRSIHDGATAENTAIAVSRSVAKDALYDEAVRKAARERGEVLTASLGRLRKELEFAPDARFELAGNGDPDLYFFEVARAVRASLVDKAQQFGVDMSGENLVWESPVGRAEIERTLACLCVLEHAVERLLDASEFVRQSDPEASGLQRIEKFEVVKAVRTNTRRTAARTTRRPRATRDDAAQIAPAVDVEELAQEYVVSFRFRADAATTHLFLERCRAMDPPILLREGLQLKRGSNPGDPLLVTGQVVGIQMRDE